jgi:hypothetical protein
MVKMGRHGRWVLLMEKERQKQKKEKAYIENLLARLGLIQRFHRSIFGSSRVAK